MHKMSYNATKLIASERVSRKQADERKASKTSVFLFHDINNSLYLLTVPSSINLEICLLNWVFASLFLFDQVHKNEQKRLNLWNCNVQDNIWGNRKAQQEIYELLGFLSNFSYLIPLQGSGPTGLVFVLGMPHTGIKCIRLERCFWAILAFYNMARLHLSSPSANQIKILLHANTTLTVRKLCLISSLYISIFSLEPFVLFQCCPLISIKLVPKCC